MFFALIKGMGMSLFTDRQSIPIAGFTPLSGIMLLKDLHTFEMLLQ